MKTSSAVGTEPGDLVRAARANGLRARAVERMSLQTLSAHARAGAPVIVLYQAWADEPKTADYARTTDNGHYAVVIGMDQHNVYLQDPWIKGKRGVVPRLEFASRWHGLDHDRRVKNLGIVIEPTAAPVAVHSVGELARSE